MADQGGGGQKWATVRNNGQQSTTIDNHGQQWTTICSATSMSDAVFSCPKTAHKVQLDDFNLLNDLN